MGLFYCKGVDMSEHDKHRRKTDAKTPESDQDAQGRLIDSRTFPRAVLGVVLILLLLLIGYRLGARREIPPSDQPTQPEKRQQF